MRTADEIRQHFIDVLNNALPRLDMYGGEIAAHHFLLHLAFVDNREAELNTHFDALRKRGAFSSTGVAGAFNRHTHARPTGNEIGSVYAEIAFQMGYLTTNRVLSNPEFESLRSGLREICRVRDFTTKEVHEEFGAPSWVSGTNPFCPWVFLYITEQPTFGAIAFDFWNEVYYDGRIEKTCGKYGNLPVLRNVRIRGTKFSREFTFTPIGRTISKRT